MLKVTCKICNGVCIDYHVEHGCCICRMKRDICTVCAAWQDEVDSTEKKMENLT